MVLQAIAREQELEDQVELLQQKLDGLTGSSQEIGVLMSLRFGMTHTLAGMLLILVKRAPAIVSRPVFHTLFYGDRSDGGPEPKIFDVRIHRLRDILQRVKCPGKIDTIWHAGYRANPQLVQWVNDLYKTHIPE